VEQDYYKAGMWYTTAAKNGIGGAANKLGCCFFDGRGVPKNEMTAEGLWKQAVELKNADAAMELVDYYIRHLEPEKAQEMFRIRKNLKQEDFKNDAVADDDKNFKTDMQTIIKERNKYKHEVTAFEKKFGVVIFHNLTFLQRTKLMGAFENENMKDLLKNLKTFPLEKYFNQFNYFIQDLQRKAIKGSVTAAQVLETLSANDGAVHAFQSKKIVKFDCAQKEEWKPILNLLYKCATLEFQFVHIPPEIERSLNSFFSMMSCDCLMRTTKNEDDMKVRLCMLRFASKKSDNDHSSVIKQLEKCIKMYPENVHFYHIISTLYGHRGDHKSGLVYAERGLKRFPTDVNLLYIKAVHLREKNFSANSKKTELIKAYNDFVQNAHEDHSKVPEAYYALATLFIPDDKRMMEFYYECGKNAEANMLLCYLPCARSTFRASV